MALLFSISLTFRLLKDILGFYRNDSRKVVVAVNIGLHLYTFLGIAVGVVLSVMNHNILIAYETTITSVMMLLAGIYKFRHLLAIAFYIIIIKSLSSIVRILERMIQNDVSYKFPERVKVFFL